MPLILANRALLHVDAARVQQDLAVPCLAQAQRPRIGRNAVERRDGEFGVCAADEAEQQHGGRTRRYHRSHQLVLEGY